MATEDRIALVVRAVVRRVVEHFLDRRRVPERKDWYHHPDGADNGRKEKKDVPVTA